MPTILLTGAGFSRNWGGWLADEAFEYLLGCTDITQIIRQQLWLSKNLNRGFEDTLQELRILHARHPDDSRLKNELRTFETMLEGMFQTMKIGFMNVELEPWSDKHLIGPAPHDIRNFLCRFDAIFTLNQDTFLEQRYAQSNLQQGSEGKWFELQSPGLKPVTVGGKPYESPGVFTPDEPPYSVLQRRQPYFKLHGSSNWRIDNYSALLIMGGNKSQNIDQIPLLNWYRDEFRRMAFQPDARLMIIGYGFQDMHINEMIEAAVKAGAKLFIIDPAGVDVLKRAPDLDLKDKIQFSVLGASRRWLRESLSGDTVERTKIMKFFPIFPQI